MTPIQQLMLGVGAKKKTYVDDVFSTFAYTGTGSARSINNGINLSGEGGLTWFKRRDGSYSNVLVDTVRGAGNTKAISSESTNAEGVHSSLHNITSFNNNGFTIGVPSSTDIINQTDISMANWTFRKAPGFFDVVTYTGTGSNTTIAHSLGSVPGCILIKCTSAGFNWRVYHRGANSGVNPANYGLSLNTAAAEADNATYFNDTLPTSTHFTIGTNSTVNSNGSTYVAYIFAHDDQSLGENENASVIKCGTFTGNGTSGGKDIDLGWEPQWVLMKASDTGNAWAIIDCIRGSNGQAAERLMPSSSSNSTVVGNYNNYAIQVTSTGFTMMSDDEGGGNGNGNNYIYVAIRRPDGYVGKQYGAGEGTSVFAMDTGNSSSTIPAFDSGFAGDFATWRTPAAQGNWNITARLIGNHVLSGNLNAAEQDESDGQTNFDSSLGFGAGGGFQTSSSQAWMWKRHAGFDVVTYNGTGSQKNINHSLNKVPEMMWVKIRSRTGHWTVYHKDMHQGYGSGNNYNFYMHLNEENARVAGDNQRWAAAPTSSVFTVGTSDNTNKSGHTLMAMLFASVDGISKVGYFTGNGSNSGPSITTGFSPRFIIVKAASVADKPWLVFDTLRGIASGADARLTLDTNAAQTTSTDWLDTTSTGFDITFNSSNINSSGEEYIYYAHA